MPPSYALLYFRKERVYDIVHISYVNGLLPNGGFKKEKVYNVGWPSNPADRTRPKDVLDYAGLRFKKYPAFVIRVAESEGELQDFLDSGQRIRIPNVTTTSTEPVTDATDTECDAVLEQQRQLIAKAKKQAADKAATSSKRLAEVLQKNKTMPVCPSDSSDDNEMPPSMSGTAAASIKNGTNIAKKRIVPVLSDSSDNDDERSTGSKHGMWTKAAASSKTVTDVFTEKFPAELIDSDEEDMSSTTYRSKRSTNHKHKVRKADSEDEIKYLRRENKKLRKLNLQLQTHLLEKLEAHKSAEPISTSSTTDEDISVSSQESKSSSQALPKKYSLEPQEINMLDRRKKASMFTKNLAVRFIGSDTLRESSLDGKTPNRGNNTARPALDSVVITAIKELVCRHYGSTEGTKVNRYITEKIADLRKSVK